MIKETEVLADLAQKYSVTVGHARVVASVKYESYKHKEYTVTWHLIGGRTTKSKLTAIAHAKKINHLIARSPKSLEILSDEQRQYNAGLDTRLRGLDKSVCPFEQYQMKLRASWLAGWHDADMEK